MVLQHLLPTRFPGARLGAESMLDGNRRSIALPPLRDEEELEKLLRQASRYGSILAATTEGKDHEWEQEKQEIMEALASPDPASRAYAMDMLGKYAAPKVEEAAAWLERLADPRPQ